MCDLIKDNVSGPCFKGPNPSRLDPRQRQKNNINFILLCGASKGFMKALKDLWGTVKLGENNNLC